MSSRSPGGGRWSTEVSGDTACQHIRFPDAHGKPSAVGNLDRVQESVQHAVCAVPSSRMRLPASPPGPDDGLPELRQQQRCQGHPKQTPWLTPSRKAIIPMPLGRLIVLATCYKLFVSSGPPVNCGLSGMSLCFSTSKESSP